MGTNTKKQTLLISAAIVLLTLIAFEPVRHNGFVDYDDAGYITENHNIQSGITYQSVIWAFTTFQQANWHPLTWLSHMLDIELFGLNPVGHHLHNIILHTISAILLFLILKQTTGGVWPAAFVAAVFAIHPLRVESVAWAAERKDVLSVLFWMLTILAYLSYARKGGLPRHLLVIVCFALGLMAKPMLVTLPIILLILDWWPLRRMKISPAVQPIPKSPCNKANGYYRKAPAKRLIAEKIPLLILTAMSCVITYMAQSSGGSVTESLKYFIRILNAVNSYGAYIVKILWPANLAVLYPYPHPVYPMWPPTISFVFLLLWSLFVFVNRHKRPYLATGWLWYVITLVPVVGIVQVGSQTMADRYTYLPSIGILMIIGFAAAELTAPWRYRKIVLVISSGLLLFALTAATRTQLTYWKDGAALYEHTIKATKDNAVICDYLSSNLLRQGKNELAGRYIIKSLEIEPDSVEANMNMAFLLMSRGQPDEAMNYLRRVQKIKPDEARVYYNMGAIFEIRNQPEQALEAYEQAIRLDKTHSKALARAAVLKEQLGRTDEQKQPQ